VSFDTQSVEYTSHSTCIALLDAYFGNLRKKPDFLMTVMTHFEGEKFHLLLRPESADRKTLDVIPRAEKHNRYFAHLFFDILIFLV
jgi:hypothetical protein